MTTRRLILPSELTSTASDVECIVADGIVPERALVGLVAKPAKGKSFLAIHTACCIATGRPWFGRATKLASVLYVAAEGFSGIPKRVQAWCDAHETTPEALDERLAFMRAPLDISDDLLVTEVLEEAQDLGISPSVIFLDTLSANAPPGFDESSTAQMKLMMDAARALRDRLPCSVVIVHHEGHQGGRARGSSDFFAGVDTELMVEGDGAVRAVRMSKCRDFPLLQGLRFSLRPTGGSAVVEPLAEGASPADDLQPSHHQLLSVLVDQGPGVAVPGAEWQRRAGVPRSSFYRSVKELKAAGLVLDTPRGFLLTHGGESLMSVAPRSLMGLPKLSRDQSHQSPPLKGGTGNGSRDSLRDSHGTPMRQTRAEGPGLQPVDWDAIEATA
ncbi:MAG: AAA family ATPase [Gemmatimonadetes bacterium]|nr:AAA family ATPase [Gemmatimonadota bacterium]